ncbi:MAG: NAD-dependent epimerase/dehydratase family protein, partial [Halobacteriota archaeon]
MMTVTTWATGFLGSALVPTLRRRQQAVRITARDERKAYQQYANGITIISGDSTGVVHVQQAIDGATATCHLVEGLHHPSIPADVHRKMYVDGTRTLPKVCDGQTQLQRIVRGSTAGVHGVTDEVSAAESARYASTNPYEVITLEGELLAQFT